MNKNRILSLILSVMMLFTIVFSTGVFAEEDNQEYEPEVEEIVVELGYDDDDEIPGETEQDDGLVIIPEEQDDESAADSDEDDAFGDGDDDELLPEASSSLEEDDIVMKLAPGDEGELGAPAGNVVVTATAEKSSVKAGDTVKITAEATNTVGTLTYRWQRSNDGGNKWTSTSLPGYNTAELSFEANEQRLSYIYRCRVTDDNGNWFSEGVAVTIGTPTVTAAAEKDSVKIGEMVKITATAECMTGDLVYQWQRKSNSGTKWTTTSLTGYNTPELSFEATELRLSYSYRCRVTDANGDWYSEPVQIGIDTTVEEPTVTATAEKSSVQAGETVKITAVATNTVGALTYRWQRSNDGGHKWTSTSLPGYDTAELSFEASELRLSYIYRCRVTDDNGDWYSEGVTVTMGAPTVTATAEKDSVKIGEMVKITATTENMSGDLVYQWQRKSNSGTKWTTTSLTGYNTAELSFEATELRLSYSYRCCVTDANGDWYSEPVQIGIDATVEEPTVTAAAEKSSVQAGETVRIAVEATNTVGALVYRWQRSNDGGHKWTSTSLPGYDTAELSFEANELRLSYIYRCRVTDSNGEWYSNEVEVTLGATPVVTAAAEKDSVKIGEMVKITATTENMSGDLVYQWQRKTIGGTKWTTTSLTGYNTAELSFEATELRLSYSYRCCVTDANGDWYSEPVQIGIDATVEEPTVTAAAEKSVVIAGETVKITAEATNTVGTVAYRWQRSNDGGNKWNSTSLPGYDTAELSFEANELRMSYIYRCRVTDSNGEWYSNEVEVTLGATPVVTATAEKDSVRLGEMVKITATTENTTGDLTYQWQRKTIGGTKWTTTSLTGYNTAELSFEATELRLSYSYRCCVTDANGSWYSEPVEITLETAIVIDDVTYEAITDTTCMVVSYAGTASSLVIPTTVENMTVTEIGVEAFMDNATLTSIDLPNTITIIHARAFKNCTSLSEMKNH